MRRGVRRWRVEICVDGKRESKTMDTKSAALTWAVEREAVLRRDVTLIHGKTLKDAYKRFNDEIVPSRKGWRWERRLLDRLCHDEMATVPLPSLTMQDGKDFVSRSLKRGLKPNSVIREMNLIKVVVRQAVDWKWLTVYPWAGMKMPTPGRARDRLPTAEEINLIIEHSGLIDRKTLCKTRMQETAAAFLLSIETAMRQGEICKLEWSDIDVDNRVARLRETKNGSDRAVPLSSRAIEILGWFNPDRGRVLDASPAVCSTMFRRICKRAGITGLTFHDARAEATVRLSKKLDIFQLARVTGHHDYAMLQVYYRESAADIAKMLD